MGERKCSSRVIKGRENDILFCVELLPIAGAVNENQRRIKKVRQQYGPLSHRSREARATDRDPPEHKSHIDGELFPLVLQLSELVRQNSGTARASVTRLSSSPLEQLEGGYGVRLIWTN